MELSSVREEEDDRIYGPPADALATSHVGSYTLYTTIGEGAFGKVKIAVHEGTNERVAVKIMDKKEIRQQDFTQQVRREIHIMRRLKHKHIVRMHEVLTSETKLYIVMELVTGGELFDRIEHGRVSEHMARHYFQQLVDGVDFCHKKGVAHRDLKPENLLVDDRGNIKITDFGFSSMKGRDVNAGLLYTQCGTPDYCAPEIIECAKDGYIGAKVDAWSCGIILYALLCGRLPFQDHDLEKLYDLILACKVEYPALISLEARDLLRKLLVRDPAHRYDLQDVKRHPWFMVNYAGGADDLKGPKKKRPFYNKNHRELIRSSPSSPLTAAPTSAASLLIRSPAVSPVATATVAATSEGLYQHVPLDCAGDDGHEGSTEPPSSVSVPSPNSAVGSFAAHDGIYLNMPASTGSAVGIVRHSLPHPLLPPLPSVRRLQTDTCAPAVPLSPAGVFEPAVRVESPLVHAKFSPSQNRPATPDEGPGHTGMRSPVVVMAEFEEHGSERLLVEEASVGEDLEPNSEYGVVSESQSGVRLSLPRASAADDSASEQDSIEDYEEKPALQLELPTEPGGYRPGRHSGVLSETARSRASGLPSDVENGPSSMPSLPLERLNLLREETSNVEQSNPRLLRLSRGSEVPTSPVIAYSPSGPPGVSAAAHVQRHGYMRETGQLVPPSDPRLLRIARAADVPGSPSVVYSPSASASSYDRMHVISPGVGNSRVGGGSTATSPNNGTYSTGISGFPAAWQPMSANGSIVMEAGSSAHRTAYQPEVLSRYLWKMMCKLRGTTAPAGEALSQKLRSDLYMMLAEMSQASKSDIVATFTSFLSLFESQGLGEGPTSSSSAGWSQNRSQGASDVEEEQEEGVAADPREERAAGNGYLRYAQARRTTTDVSWEEEPLSWSPVLANSSRYESDLARRRNVSDLLNRMIRKTDPATNQVSEGDERGAFPNGDEVPSSSVDLNELERLMRGHHGGHEESKIADEFLRLMNRNNAEGVNENGFGNTVHLHAHGPPGHAVRSGESFPQTRHHSHGVTGIGGVRPNTPLRSTSGNNVPLPSEYIPGRFQEANSMPVNVRLGQHRPRGFAGRGRSDMGHILSRQTADMATSMGLHNVAYYGSDRKHHGVGTKLRSALLTMKTKNQKLGERHAQFRTTVPPDEIMRMLGRILQDMGASVSIKRETKRKMKCQLQMQPGWTLFAGIELNSAEGEGTIVAFRRSRMDRGRTDTDSFHKFFEQVRGRFGEATSGRETRRGGPTSKKPPRSGEVGEATVTPAEAGVV